MADVTVQPLKNGPLMVKGSIQVLDSNGEVMQELTQAALCRCGHSAKKPFCDGMHRSKGFESVCVKAAGQ